VNIGTKLAIAAEFARQSYTVTVIGRYFALENSDENSKKLPRAAPVIDFRRIFEFASNLVLVLDPELRIVAVSNTYLQATLTTREQILSRHIFEIFPDNPDDPNADGVRNLRASLERVLQTGKPDTMGIQKYDVRRPESEGGGFEERYWSPVNAPAFDENGRIEYIIHSVSNVTEFVRLEQIGSEARIRASHMEAEMFGRSKELGEANRQLRALNEGLARLHAKVAALTSNPETELSQDPLTPEEAIDRVAQLVASQHNLQEQLRQAQKMEAIGRFAGGVAHDFNNLLTVITGQASLAEEELRDSPIGDRLREVQKAADRAAALTRQLLAFSRKQVLQMRVLDFNGVVADMENMLRRLVPSNISLVTVKSRGAGRVKADRSMRAMPCPTADASSLKQTR
jgi:signal transduction histidine kinase